MAVLLVVALLFVGATARPNGGQRQGPPMPGANGGQGGRFPSGPMGGGNFPGGPMGGGNFPGGPMGGGNFPGGPMGGGNFPGGPMGGGNFPGGPMGGGNFPGGPMGGGNFPGGPMGGGNFPGGPMGGGNFPGGPMGGGSFPGGPMVRWPIEGGAMGGPGQNNAQFPPVPAQLNAGYPGGEWDLQLVPDSDEMESFRRANGEGFAPSDYSARRGPQGGRPPFVPGGPHRPHPPHPRPDGVRPNITFVPLFQTGNVTIQNISATAPLKAGENIFLLPLNGVRPPQFGFGPPVFGPQPYFKITYNPNATQNISFEFGVAQIQRPSPLWVK